MQPFNYSIDVPNPSDSFLKGASQGFALQDRQRAEQSAVIAQQQQMQAQQQQMQMQQELNALSQKPNPTAQDYARVSTRYPQLADKFKTIWEPLDAEQKTNKVALYSQVLSALKNGSPDVAEQLMTEQAAAFKAAGDDAQADSTERLAQMLKLNPKMAMDSAALALTQALGPDKFAANYASLLGTESDIAKTGMETRKLGFDIANIESQIGERAARLNLDKDKLMSEMELKISELDQKKNPALKLDAGAEKILNDAAIASVTAEQSAGTMRDLASRLEQEGGGYGTFGKASEWLKSTVGNENAMSDMRKEYLRIRNGGVLAMLPPGAASDKDIEIAMAGFPSEASEARYLAKFIRGMAKLQEVAAVSENVKSEWINNVGNLGKARQDIEIDGVKVPAGMPYSVFAKKYIAETAKARETKINRKSATDYWSQQYPSSTPSDTPGGATGSY